MLNLVIGSFEYVFKISSVSILPVEFKISNKLLILEMKYIVGNADAGNKFVDNSVSMPVAIWLLNSCAANFTFILSKAPGCK
jgi:hypothetical protein